MKYKFFIILCFSLSFGKISLAQNTLSFEEYMTLVEKYHPLVKQANLITDRAEGEIRAARGLFDPKLFHDRTAKDFENKEYFDLQNSGLKVPTWFGVEVKAGYEYNTGKFLNPENNVTDNGLTYLGVSLPILQGFVIDKRRAELRKAQLYRDMSVQEQQLQLNDVLFDAISAYWNWSQTYEVYQVYKEAIAVSEERYGFVKQSFRFGDVPAIDTLEALILLQNRQISTQEARLKYVKASLELSNYLWYENSTPLEVTDSIVPTSFENHVILLSECREILDEIDQTILQSPAILAYNFKLRQLDVDRRLKAEKLKPKLNVNYNLLQRDFGAQDFMLQNNYKWGLSFSFPIFLREARGNLQVARLKIQQTQFDLDQKKRVLKNKLVAVFNQLETYQDLMELTNDNANNYQRLFNAEVIKVSIGESSLFKLNAREVKLLEARAKYAKMSTERLISYYLFYWTIGTIPTSFNLGFPDPDND